jgi:hypothetical protein
MNDAYHGTNWERTNGLRNWDKPKKVVHSTGKPSKATHVAKPLSGPQIRKAVKKVAKKKKPVKKLIAERHRSREVRYFIFQKTEEGRLVHPMHRQRYDHSDSNIFDHYNGYATQEEAHAAIEANVIFEDDSYQEMGFEKNFYGMETRCCQRSEEYLVIPQLRVNVWWEKID